MESSNSQNLNEGFLALTRLEKGERYTLITLSGFGVGVCSSLFTLQDVKVSEYAQYSESVQLIFKLKGARTLKAMRFHGSKSFAIWKGWHDIKTDAFSSPEVTESNGTQITVSRSRYSSFDERYLTDAIASISIAPLFSKLNLNQ